MLSLGGPARSDRGRGEALGGARIIIEGLAVPRSRAGVVHVLVADAGAVQSAFEAAGIKVEGESDVLSPT